MNILIPLLVIFPLASALLIFCSGQKNKAMIPVGVLAALLTLLLSIGLVFQVYQGTSVASGNVDDPNLAGAFRPAVVFEPEMLKFNLPANSRGESFHEIGRAHV